MKNEPDPTDVVTEIDSIVAVFDTKTVALRAVGELLPADFTDVWIGVVRGESEAGETTVAGHDGVERPLRHVLRERGIRDGLASRFDGLLPPATAVMSLRATKNIEHAMHIIEVAGGHIEDV